MIRNVRSFCFRPLRMSSILRNCLRNWVSYFLSQTPKTGHPLGNPHHDYTVNNRCRSVPASNVLFPFEKYHNRFDFSSDLQISSGKPWLRPPSLSFQEVTDWRKQWIGKRPKTNIPNTFLFPTKLAARLLKHSRRHHALQTFGSGTTSQRAVSSWLSRQTTLHANWPNQQKLWAWRFRVDSHFWLSVVRRCQQQR